MIRSESDVSYCSSLLLILKSEHACDWSESLEQEPFAYKNISNLSLLLADHESWIYAIDDWSSCTMLIKERGSTVCGHACICAYRH
jgi:hypothetical protein